MCAGDRYYSDVGAVGMAVAVFVPSRIGGGDFTDLPAPGAGDDAKAITYDHGTQAFVYAAGGVTDHGALTGLSDNDHPQYVLTSDTRSNILASSPALRTVALSSDTLEMFVWNGSAWYVAPLELIEQGNTADMGLTPPMVANDRAGYSATYITDKTIYNSAIGGNNNTDEGGIRVSSSTYQAYLNGVWNDIVLGFRFREDENGAYELEHRPIGFDWWIEVMSGNSDDLGLNGLPLAQQYSVSMGAYPVHQQIQGREITA